MKQQQNKVPSKINILIVDDRPDKLIAMEAALECLNQNIVKVSSGTDALRALLNEDFAVILLDVSMPGMDGFQTASLIRQRIRSEHTPIIFVTSINTNETHVSRGYSLGAVDYVFSPIEPEILRAKVAVFIDLFKKTEQIKEQSELLRLEAEKKADFLENRLRGLLNRLNVGFFKANSNGDIAQKNPAFDRLFKLTSEKEIRAFNLRKLIPDLDTFVSKRNFDENVSRDVEWAYADCGSIWLAVTLSLGQRLDGTLFVEGIIDDISNRKKNEELLINMNEILELRVHERSEELRLSQEHLRRSERLASLGTLAAGIAHEINNPLNSILMSSEHTRRTLAKNGKLENETVEKTLGVISDNTKRCARIIKGVLQFARNQKTAKCANDLISIVRNSSELMKTYIKTPLEINIVSQEETLLIHANQTEIEQVVINILQNAAEANKGSTVININLQKYADQVRLSIQDNGPGIHSDIIDKIFDPFFSTRAGKGGTGLGLSVAHGIITEHGGSLTVQNLAPGGADFIITLPELNPGSIVDDSQAQIISVLEKTF